MRRGLSLIVLPFTVLMLQASARAQDILVPAGTLLHCTLDEPNLSSATASAGDPVICHLRSFQEFGHVVLPRGSYLEDMSSLSKNRDASSAKAISN